MKEYAWVLLSPSGVPLAIDGHDAEQPWLEWIQDPTPERIAEFKDAGYRCLRVKLVEVGPVDRAPD